MGMVPMNERFALWSAVEGDFVLRYATPGEVRMAMKATLDLVPNAQFRVYAEDNAPPTSAPIVPEWLDKPFEGGEAVSLSAAASGREHQASLA